MSTKVFRYILDFSGNAQKLSQDIGGIKGMLKGAAAAAGALFAADMVMDGVRAVGQYAKEISGVRDNVAELTGVQGAALDTMTGQVKAIADAYDADVDQAIKASNLVMRQFGESGKDAFDIINAGMATAANANDDFLEQVEEYAPHFKEAGLAAGEMVAIMAKGNELGVFNDKTADAIKEGTIRLREMTKSTREALDGIGLSSDVIQREISTGSKTMFQVMQQVSRQLKTLPEQAPAVGAALADIFGGVGEDAIQFIRNLDEIDPSMKKLLENATESAKAQIEWGDELREFHTVASQVFGDTNTLLLRVKTSSLALANDSIKWLVSWTNYFIDLYNESEYFRYQIDAIAFAFKTLWGVAKLTINSIADAFSFVVQGIKDLFAGDFTGAEAAFDELKSNFVEFGEDFAKTYKESFKKELGPREKIKLIGLSDEDARAAGQNAGKNMAAGVQSAMSALPKTVKLGELNIQSPGEIDENLFDPSSAEGQANMLSAVLGGLGREFAILDEQAKIFGSSIDLISEKKQYLTAQINQLISEGFTAESEAVKVLKNELDGLGESHDKLEAKANIVAGAFEQGFAQIGQSIIDSLGLARDGFEGFVAGMASAVTELIAMAMASSIAYAIEAGSLSALGTGFAAVFSAPAFIAAAVGGVMAAFAAIPSFTTGGIMPGTSFHGDRLLARVNSGEEILRRDDPRHTFNQTVSRQTPAKPVVAAPSIEFGYDKIYAGVKLYEEEMYKRT